MFLGIPLIPYEVKFMYFYNKEIGPIFFQGIFFESRNVFSYN